MYAVLAQSVSVPAFTFDLSEVLTWIIIGFIAGTLAELFVRGRGRGPFVNIVVGLIGAFIGGILLRALNPSVSSELQQGILLRYIDIIVAFVGALIVLIVLGALFRRRL